MTTGSIYCNTIVSSFDIDCALVSVTNSSFEHSETIEGVSGSAPNIACQICQSPAHSTVSYRIHYQPKHTSSIPVMATFSPIKAFKNL